MSPVASSNAGAGTPSLQRFQVQVDAVAAGADATSEGFTAPRTGYLTKASFVAAATLTGANTDTRTHTVVDPSTRAITDGIVAVLNTSANKGPWASGSYSTGDIVTYNNQTYIAIASATTEVPGASPTKWTALNSAGLNVLTSLTGAFTPDDVGRSISGTGYTSAVITGYIDAQTVTTTANSAVRNALSVTIGSSRTLATLAYVSGVVATADVPKDLTLSTTDTKVYKGDTVKVVSAHSGSTGLADPGGVMVLEFTSYGEGSD